MKSFFVSVLVAALALLLSGCAAIPTEPGLKAVVGGSLQTTLGAEPLPFTILIIAGGKIRDVGPQSNTPIPKGAETISAKGKVIRPMLGMTIAAGQPADFLLTDNDPKVPDQVYSNGERVQ